ncbi:PAS domain-containing sensor histidine kinase [Adhaeribacter rhizoryzae]|uniref:histidine kinase n=1 Tax=Adhaeribacter rhizoryzae TaxID=2607907 RepID=A0A5M6DBE5_9BACT|nr:PAS domain-containing sensor histidine kinase [Adhaeribacter rhizoryzae]KAA5544874.1 PAS domain-containing sensor histidine kinase [Adhaeribacter rhizoryzae]
MSSAVQVSSNVSFPGTSEDRYRLLIENITDYAIFLLDATGHVATWNAGAQRIKQYEAVEIIGRHFSTFYTTADKDRDYPAFELKEAQAKGRYEDEGWRVRKDGTVFWANVIISPVYNQERALIGFSKITRDLSERKRAEDNLFKAYEELKDSEEKYRLLIGGVTDYAIFMLDPAGHVATWNEGAKRIKGYEPHEIIGKYFSKFYSRDAVLQGYPDYVLKQARAVGRYEDEGWRYRKDGSAFWANVVITAIYNPKKELIGFSKITRDLTDKKQLEEKLFRINEELKESEEKYRLLINSVQDYAILMLNPEGLITSWNVGAERINGYQANEIIGKHISVFYPREAIENGYPQFELAQAIENGRFEDEGWRLRKDGTAFWANVILTPVYNTDKRLLGFAKITRDLTERRRNEELMRKNLELVRINNDLDNFVYTASHDLKAPIDNLEGLLMALQEDLGSDINKHQEILSLMDSSIISLKHVITDLGDITQVQQDKEKAEKVNIPRLINEVKESLRDLILTHQVQIIVETLEFESLVYSRKNIRSILYNLVSNAIKYADPKRQPQVSISSIILPDNTYQLSVSDNGLGIAPNQTDKIFALFKRAHSHVEGSGIGLYLVKKILDNSGDRIVVESELNQGSTFKVLFSPKLSF